MVDVDDLNSSSSNEEEESSYLWNTKHTEEKNFRNKNLIIE